MQSEQALKNIAIVAGGDSPEYEVSVNSAREVSRALEGNYNAYILIIRKEGWYYESPKGQRIPVDKNTFSLDMGEEKIRFDGVFNAIHGTPGEDGLLQGYLDMMGIPYSSSGVFVSALTFNKHFSKQYLMTHQIPMARHRFLHEDDDFDPQSVLKEVGLPCFVKPNASGSSFGVTRVNRKEDFVTALEAAFQEGPEIMVEAFMDGTEVACGVICLKNRQIVLPVTEIVSKKEFFDYEAKYTPGMADEIAPARISKAETQKVQKLSSRICDILGCRGIARVDFIIVRGEPLFLEVNTVPGMSAESILPKAVKAHGLTMEEVYTLIIEDMLS